MTSTEPWANVNGQFLPLSQAALPLHDSGFVWGATVTDLCRTIRLRLYRWPEHLQRFRRNAEALAITLPVNDSELTTRAEELVQRNVALIPPESDLSLIVCATPGPLGYYVGASGIGPPTLLLQTFPIPFARYRSLHERGARLVVPSVRQIPDVCVNPRIKQRSRLHWWLAEQEVHRSDPGATALLLDETGCVTETAAASLLVVKQGKVWTPPRERILDSISLNVVAEGCRALELEMGEAAMSVEEVQCADEAMLANSNFCLAGVSAINGKTLPWPGPIFERLLAWWSQSVGFDLRAQIMACLA